MLEKQKLPFEVSVQFYDALYADKNYTKEAFEIHEQIHKYCPKAKTVLDLGCGTGRHAEELEKLGYQVTGVDLSPEMIRLAKTRNQTSSKTIQFHVGDVRSVNLNETFDVVISLFHVASYQTTDADLNAFIQAAKNHLKPKGLFIFDFWCALGVLAEPPQVRVKRVKTPDGEIIRITEPVHHIQDSIVDVNFEYLKLKSSGSFEKYYEQHRMRYFLPDQIKKFAENVQYRVFFDDPLVKKNIFSSSLNVIYLSPSIEKL